MRKIDRIDYIKQLDERKKVAHLIQTGRNKQGAFHKSTGFNVVLNRIIILILLLFVCIIGCFSIFS